MYIHTCIYIYIYTYMNIYIYIYMHLPGAEPPGPREPPSGAGAGLPACAQSTY